MRRTSAWIVALAMVATPVFADKKLDDAVAKAEDQLQKGKPEEAVKTVQKIAEQSPSAEAYLALARIQERAGNLDEAAAAVAKAAQLAQSADAAVKAEALAAQASMELSRGSSKEALAAAEKAVAAQPTPAALAALARAQARAHQGQKALETADKAVAAGATSALAHEARGEALLSQSRYADAEAAFRKALEVDPKFNRGRVGLARALAQGGKAAEAVTEARKATEADPKSGEAFAALGLALLAQDPKNWSDAIAQAQQGAFLNPKSPAVQIAVGTIFDSAGNIDQAAAAYKRALESDPANSDARLALIQAQVRKGDSDGAIAEATKLTQEVPGNGEAWLLLGRSYLRKNDFANGMTALEKAASLSPGNAEAQALLGTAYQYNRKSDEAVAAYKKAVDLAPNRLDYRTTYGLLLGVGGQYEPALAQLKQVVANPSYKDDDAWVNLGWVYRNMTPPKIDESVAAYKKALEINPKGEQSALGMGWAYSYGKNWDGAIGAFEQAIKIEPKTAGEAHDGMAWSYFFKKDLPKAKEMLEKAKGEGRPDTKLATNIERVETLMARGGAEAQNAMAEAEHERERQRQQEAKFASLNQGLSSKDANLRCRAMRDIAGLIGVGDAMPYLIRALTGDPSYSVRICAANALAAIGPGAKAAVPYLKATISAPKNESLVASKEEMQEMMKDEDLRRAARDALAKIGG
jgi:tetratricopeptide (TPR) repeat protein